MGAVDATVAACRAEIATLRAKAEAWCEATQRHIASRDAALARVGVLERAAQATLLWFSGKTWDEDALGEWIRLTGKPDATSKILCDTVRAALSSPPPHDGEGTCRCGKVKMAYFTGTHSKLTKEGERFISTNHRRDRCDREEVIPDAPHDGEGK